MTAGACELCGSAEIEDCLRDAVDYVTGATFVVRQCSQCGLAWTDPRPSSMDQHYPAVYRDYRGLTSWTLRRLYRWRVRGWAKQLPKEGRAFEVGCGAGWMLSALRERGWRVLGNERAISSANAAAHVHRIPVFVGGLDALHSSAKFDLVILFQSLEHVSEPLTMLRRCADLLRQGGSLVVAVPNFDSWQARLFGRSWLHLDVPRHLYHFCPPSLKYALEKAGLQVARTRFMSPEHDPYGWVQSALNRMGFSQNLLLKRLMGYRGNDASVGGLVAMVALSGVLAVPSVALSLCSWIAGSGAILEMRATKE